MSFHRVSLALRSLLTASAVAASLALLGAPLACSTDDAEVSAQKTCSGGTQCVCKQDCSLDCPAGGCSFTCNAGATCSFSCAGGNCSIAGVAGTKVDCSGGGCTLSCGGAANCACTEPAKCTSDANDPTGGSGLPGGGVPGL